MRGEPVLIVHRGLHTKAPENTIPAFQQAWEHGADGIEGDFYITKDGVVVCSHDSNTLRTSGVDFVIEENSFADLRKIDQGAKKSSEYANTSTPTLKEVLATVPKGKKIFIEIKGKGTKIVEPLEKVVAESGLEDSQIIFISFGAESIRLMKERRPEWKTLWLTSLTKDPNTNPSPEKIIAKLKSIQADGVDVRADPRLNKEFIKAIHDAGFECHFWVVNEPNRAWELVEMGADSITTDRIDILKPAFDEKKKTQ